MAPAAFVIAPQSFGHELRVELQFDGEKFKEQFHESQQGDAVGAFNARVQPVAPAQKGMERRGGAGILPANLLIYFCQAGSLRYAFQINGVLSKKLPLLPTMSQYFAKRRKRCIVAKSMSLFCRIS